MNNKFIILWLILLTILNGCGGHSIPSCITTKTENLQIRWGERNNKTGYVKGFLITAKSELFSIQQETENKELFKQRLKNIDNVNFCSKLSLVQYAIMRNQTLNVPGDTIHFIEYENPGTKIFVLAEWNPKYNNAGNKDFRALYDSLQTLVK